MAWDKETELKLRQVIKDSGVALLKENLVQGTWGNTAVRLDEDHMLVTPTGLDYISLTPEDMPVRLARHQETQGRYRCRNARTQRLLYG